MYSGGDACNQQKRLAFSSEIRYVCDPSVEVGKPVLVKQAGLKGTFDTAEDCHFVFEWRSKMACPHCSLDQVHSVKGICIDGFRKIQTLVNNDTLCVLHPKNMKFDGSTLIEAGSLSVPLVYAHEATQNEVCELELEIL